MAPSLRTVLAFKSYQNQAGVLVRNYVLTDLLIALCPTPHPCGISSLHAVLISVMSYFVFWSELFPDHDSSRPITFSNSSLSTFALGVARILLFVYMSYHVCLHHAQVMQTQTIGFHLVFCIPLIPAIMNLVWFGKILKGLKKTLAKRK